ncbi:hypothetical protein COU62_00395 [Candidatus Pacearchaeota archaeon CG10_big_fil_rev_8_21_14_0_10_35_219]|nr:hypothetical protein [Candidatus Pacearchaeota archaeon]OIO42189.1 MAG: hypothetical protein AUJ63_02820 [Candidatus Pacearchaeota archaeon CG1_02_35_32]PIO08408.1 MAG: hypothetical protein COU62_00395 [Candidatus Pacearchaeota archaeon CG10_big_fil_rev_8_21_14_0_10_35_219]PIY81770.1 MAG: hypothetical protein COY79_00940 [Candidatus Pacearchaeota archaeon CG_4_10_14_0_8_um_filter_35_169]PIZ80850.1 MAG: hypothetical protein COY00_00360 [Candidatus Pacearchaeota archaeon CG_4_10_14_0_2_um_filt
MSLIKKASRFETRHKIISFLIVMLVTILLTRLITSIRNPNLIIKGFELHHFYYGLIIMIIILLVMVFRRGNFKLNLIITAIAIGLIIDELVFIGTKVSGPLEYTSTFSSAIILVIVIMLIVEFVFYVLKKKQDV